MRKDLRFRLRSFEFRRCGKVDKKNRRSLKICSGPSCAGHSTNVHHIPDAMRTGRDWPVMWRTRKLEIYVMEVYVIQPESDLNVNRVLKFPETDFWLLHWPVGSMKLGSSP